MGKDGANASWCSTTTDRHFRSFSAAEMREARGEQLHVRDCYQPATLNACGWAKVQEHRWNRHAEEFPGRAEEHAARGRPRADMPCRHAPKPAAYLVSERPIRPRGFFGTSLYRENDLVTSDAMKRFSDKQGPPTYAPLPKYSMEHLVRTKERRLGPMGGVGVGCGGPPTAETASEISYPTSFRSDSAPPSTAVTAETASTVGLSQAVRRMPKPLAVRRRDAFNRSPGQSLLDRDLYNEWRAQDKGSLGLQSYNFPPSQLNDTFKGHGDRLAQMAALLPGTAKDPPLNAKGQPIKEAKKG